MALVVARCNPCLRGPAASRRTQVQARPCRPISFVRFARPLFARPSAFNRYGGWDDASSEAMRDMFNEMSKQWRAQQGNISGGVYWPGGGYVFKNGRWSTADPNQTSSKVDSSNSAPSLPLDVVSAGDFYLLYADVPGLAKSDLSIKLSGPNKEPRVIKISGQRTNPFQQQQKEGDSKAANASTSSSSDSVVQQQRVFGSFSTSWELPADADSEGISAKVTDGVLTVTVPKKQQQPPQPEPEEEDGQDIFVA